ncbi:MAG: hypothetical protein AAF919_11010 [Pseudomonadota bacterium]
MNNQGKVALEPPAPKARSKIRPGDILAVGLTTEQLRSVPGRLIGALGKDAISISYNELPNVDLRETVALLSPVVGVGFDAIDVATRLNKSGFDGRYVAFGDLPDENVVRREVENVAPELVFELIPLGAGPHLIDD